MDPLIHILHLEDDPADAELVQVKIEEAGLTYQITRVQTRAEFGEALRQGGDDIILADFRLPMYDGMSALRLAQELRPDVPFIFVSGTMGEDAAIEALTQGATDYVLKQKLSRLAPAVERALRDAENHRARQQAEEALRQSERRKTILNQIANVFLTVPDDKMYTEVLAVVLQVMKSEFGIFGFIGTNNDLIIPSMAREIWDECQVPEKSIVFPPDTWGDSLWGRAIREKRAFYSDGPFHTPEGHIHIDNFLVAPIVFGNETIGIISVANNEWGYSEENKDLLEGIVSYIAPILNARLQRDQQEQERKRTEEALRESERLLAEIAANYPNSYLSIIEKDLTIGFTSGQEFKKRNLDPKSFEGLSLEQIFGEHTPTVREHYLKTFQGEETSFELFIDNQHQLYQTVPLYDKNGQITRILTVVENITERKRAERELQRSNELLRAIIEAAPTAIIGLDLDGNVQTVWNPAAEKMLGWSAQEAMGRPLPSVPVESREEFSVFRERIRSSLILDGVDVRRQRRDGSPIDYSIYASPLYDAEGGITGNIAVLVDITERKRAEEELKKHRDHLEELVRERTGELVVAKEKAETANQAKSVFLANMSHELRTPLNAILGYADILKRRAGATGSLTDGLDIIRRSGEHLLTLIDDVLDLAKIEAGKLDLTPAPIHLPTFLRQIVNIIRARAEAKELALTYEALSPLPATVLADETRLRQVLLNLLGNAVKFTERGYVALTVKRISESASQRESPETVRSVADSLTRLRFRVEDTGVGIAPEQLERIFQPFEQAGETGRRAEGTGLGLAISRQIVRLMGGRLQVESEVDQGSTFWFDVTLPLTEVAARAVPIPVRDIVGYEGPRRKVLVADDRQDNRLLLVDMLAPLGFEMSTAGDGQQAVDKTLELQPDVIVMDLVMPVKTGFEAAREMRGRPELEEVFIIAASASAFETDREKSLVAGFDAFLPKPIDWPNLATLLEEHLGLVWEYQEQEGQGAEEQGRAFSSAPPPPSSLAPLVPPPQEELKVLHDLARRGNMRAIGEQAAHIETLGGQYVPFAHKLRELAKGFEGRAILALIERYVEKG